jgi:Zn-dependent protease
MNFLLAFVSAFALCAINAWMPPTFYLYDPLASMARISISLNYAFGIFNLIPLPPLDGSKMIEAFLPFKLARKYESFAQYSFFILLALLWTGAFSVLSYPIFFCSNFTFFVVKSLFRMAGLS